MDCVYILVLNFFLVLKRISCQIQLTTGNSGNEVCFYSSFPSGTQCLTTSTLPFEGILKWITHPKVDVCLHFSDLVS